jgi:23S rRNA-/tRNA-specific pseudouridylate synthase
MRIQSKAKNTIDFVVKDGIRFVKPYSKIRKSFAKERWFGKSLLESYTLEFSMPEHICIDMINRRLLQVNDDSNTHPNQILRPNDVIAVKDICIEKPILDFQHLDFISNKLTHDFYCSYFWAVQKPHSVPIHPVAKYYKNTLHYILQTEYNITKQMRFVHRLDKCTSGIIIIADSSDATGKYHELSQANQIAKFYLARVKGKVSHVYNETNNLFIHHIKHPVVCTNLRRGLWDSIVPDQPQYQYLLDNAKDAYTQIVAIDYCEESDTTVVLCRPITGRTHQIRCHLRGIGHPIVDDIRSPDFTQNEFWEHKYSLMKQYENDEAKCLQAFQDLTIQNYFSTNNVMPQEFKIDLHSCHYESSVFQFQGQNFPDWVKQERIPCQLVSNLKSELMHHARLNQAN